MTTFMRVSSTGASPSGGLLQSIARLGLLAIGAVIGIFLLISTAAVALVVVMSLLFIAAMAFAFFWVRGKFFGKPFGGQAFADMRAQAKAQAKAQEDFAKGLYTKPVASDDGDILDAHKTAQGWTVDE